MNLKRKTNKLNSNRSHHVLKKALICDTDQEINLQDSNLKSSQKQWNLPHNKFNYPHIPINKMIKFGKIIKNSENKKTSMASSRKDKSRSASSRRSNSNCRIHSSLRHINNSSILNKIVKDNKENICQNEYNEK